MNKGFLYVCQTDTRILLYYLEFYVQTMTLIRLNLFNDCLRSVLVVSV